MKRIFIIEDDPIMASCIELSLRQLGDVAIQQFGDAISAVQALDENLPDLIFLDILLDGPDGFTLLNELGSYSDTAKIPIIIASSLDLAGQDLHHYGVVEVLNKETMAPKQIISAAKEALTQKVSSVKQFGISSKNIHIAENSEATKHA